MPSNFPNSDAVFAQTPEAQAYLEGTSIKVRARSPACPAPVPVTLGAPIPLADISDVTIAGLADNNLIAWDTATAQYTNQTAAQAGVQPGADGLTDIAAIPPVDGTLLVGDGANWVGETGDTARTSIGVGTGDTPEFTGLLVGTAPSTLDTVDVDGSLRIDHTSVEDDDHALEIDVNAAGFSDVKALDINYITGALAVSQDEAVMLVNLDETLSVGGDVTALEVLATAGSAKVNALFAGVLVSPVEQLSGTFADADSILNKAVDVTAALANGGAGAVTAFVADNDTFTIGLATKFEEIEFILTTPSSGAGIAPTFEYSTGIGTWGSFGPVDGTNGFRNTGVMAWLDGDIEPWATGTGAEYLIRITRTRNSLTTKPVLDEVQVSDATEYFWNEDGDVSVKSLALATDLALIHGGTGESLVLAGNANKVLGVNVGETALEFQASSASPTTTRGDMIQRGAAIDERLPVGTVGQLLATDGTDALWADPVLVRGGLLTRDGIASVELAVGAEDEVLTVDASGDIGWEAPIAPGVLEHVETINVTSSTTVKTTAITIEDGVHYVIKVKRLSPVNDADDLYLRVKTSGAVVTSSTYRWTKMNRFLASGTHTSSGGYSAANTFMEIGRDISNVAGETGWSGEVRFCSVAGQVTFFNWDSGMWHNNNDYSHENGSGYHDATTIIEELQFLFSTGNIAQFQAEVYKYNVTAAGLSSLAQGMDDLTDGDTTTAAPIVGDSLVWDGTNWVPGTPTGFGQSAMRMVEKIDLTGPSSTWVSSATLRDDARYMMVIHNLEISADAYLRLRVYAGGVLQTGSVYEYATMHWEYGGASENSTNAGQTYARLSNSSHLIESSNASHVGFYGVYHFGKAGTNTNWCGTGQACVWDNGAEVTGQGPVFSYQGPTDTVTGIELSMSTGNIDRLQGAIYEIGESQAGSDPGILLGHEFDASKAQLSTTLVTPADDTSPLITEGLIFSTTAYAATAAASALSFDVTVQLGASVASDVWAGLYLDASTTPLATCIVRVDGTTDMATANFQYEHLPADTASHDYKVYFGRFGAGTVYTNRTGAGARFNNTLYSALKIQEFHVAGGIATLDGLSDTDVSALTPGAGTDYVLVWNDTTQLWEPGSRYAAPVGETVEPGQSMTEGVLETWLDDNIPKPGGAAWTWEHDHAATDDLPSGTGGLAALGTGSLWTHDGAGRGYYKLEHQTVSGQFYGIEKAHAGSPGDDFCVVVRMSGLASDEQATDGQRLRFGVYAREAGAETDLLSNMTTLGGLQYANGGDGADTYNGMNLAEKSGAVANYSSVYNAHDVIEAHGGGWMYLALVVDWSAGVTAYYSFDGVSWTNLPQNTDANYRECDVGGFFVRAQGFSPNLSCAVDWIIMGT